MAVIDLMVKEVRAEDLVLIGYGRMTVSAALPDASREVAAVYARRSSHHEIGFRRDHTGMTARLLGFVEFFT